MCVCVCVCVHVRARARLPRPLAGQDNGNCGAASPGAATFRPRAANPFAAARLARPPVAERVPRPARRSGGTAQLSGSGGVELAGGELLARLRGCPGAGSQGEGVRERTALPKEKAPPNSFSERPGSQRRSQAPVRRLPAVQLRFPQATAQSCLRLSSLWLWVPGLNASPPPLTCWLRVLHRHADGSGKIRFSFFTLKA